MAREGFNGEMTFEQRLGGSHVDIGRQTFQADGRAGAKSLRWAFNCEAEPRIKVMLLALPRRALYVGLPGMKHRMPSYIQISDKQ